MDGTRHAHAELNMRSPATLRLEPEISWRAAGRAAPPFDRRLAPLLARDPRTRYTACCGAGSGALLSRSVGAPRATPGGPWACRWSSFSAGVARGSAPLGSSSSRRMPGPSAGCGSPRWRSISGRSARRVPRAAGWRSSRATISCSPRCCDHWARPEGIVGELVFKGSLESLGALARGEADIAGFHAGTTPGSDAMAPLRRLLDPRRDVLIRFAEREQGLMVRRGESEATAFTRRRRGEGRPVRQPAARIRARAC